MSWIKIIVGFLVLLGVLLWPMVSRLGFIQTLIPLSYALLATAAVYAAVVAIISGWEELERRK